jgi:hypothetical protein
MKSDSSSSRVAALRRRAVSFLMLGLALAQVGCSDRAQQVEEQVTELQKQLDQAHNELDAAQRDLSNARDGSKADGQSQHQAPTAGGDAAPPSQAALEDGYTTQAKAFCEELRSQLNGFRINSYTLHNVQMPRSFYPFTSKLSLSLQSSDGKEYQMDFPVKADFGGKWFFPGTDEVASRIEAARTAAAPGSEEAGNSQPHQDLMAVDGTYIIQWPESATPAPVPVEAAPATGESGANPAPAPAAAPESSGQTPPSVMPADREVVIKFN